MQKVCCRKKFKGKICRRRIF